MKFILFLFIAGVNFYVFWPPSFLEVIGLLIGNWLIATFIHGMFNTKSFFYSRRPRKGDD